MASGGHNLQQQKYVYESKIKTLINPDLKEICKAYGYQVSGTKAVLQKRCLESELDLHLHFCITRLLDNRRSADVAI